MHIKNSENHKQAILPIVTSPNVNQCAAE